MERKELLRKLETMLDDAARNEVYGTIELQLKAGQVELIRSSKTELMQREKTHAPQTNRPR